MKSNQMCLIPIDRDHEDVVFTPDNVAKDIIRFYKPTGRILEPAKGDGAFLKYLPGAEWCEIREGRDFFEWNKKVDWIIGNPPYNLFAVWLRHSFDIADDIVYLVPTNKMFNSSRLLRDIYQWGGIRSVYEIGPGSWLKFPIGYSVAAVHFQRNYKGGCYFAFRDRA